VYNIYSQKVRKALLDDHATTPTECDTKVKVINETNEMEEIDEQFYNFNNIKIRFSTIFYETKLTYAFVNIRSVSNRLIFLEESNSFVIFK